MFRQVLRTIQLQVLLTMSLTMISTAGCSFFGNSSIDYADTNLSIIPAHPTQPFSHCCDACTAWNVHKTKCAIGVVLKRSNLCVLKASALQPFSSSDAVAVEPEQTTKNLDLIILPPAKDTALASSAACLDGSPPAMYAKFANATSSGATKWVLYFKGGGWCVDDTDCLGRSHTLIGSSAQLNSTQPKFGYGGGGPLGDNATLNPSFSHFNRVMLWYCDGGSFTGDRADPVSMKVANKTTNVTTTSLLYYRGKRNLDAMLLYLRTHHNLGAATEVLLSGGSAGGLAAYLHADYVRSTFAPTVKFRAAPVSGFFLMHDTMAGEDVFPARGRGVFEMMNSSGGVNQRCVVAMNKLPHRNTSECFFANASYAYTETPIFPLNSAVDSFQMMAILVTPPQCAGLTASHTAGPQFSNCTESSLRSIVQYEQDFLRDLKGASAEQQPTSTPTFSRDGNGGFIESCMEHVAAQGTRGANGIAQGGVSMMDALSAWWEAPDDTPASEHWHLPCDLHGISPGQCNPTCENK